MKIPLPGEALRSWRARLGMTTRDVERVSKMIASREGNGDFAISHARLIQIENGETAPSIFKIFSLGAAYATPLFRLLGCYLPLERIQHYHLEANLPSTHLLTSEPLNPFQAITLPNTLDQAYTGGKTILLSKVVKEWGDVPVGLLQHMKLRHTQWGIVGLEDYTMYPLLRPGSIVQIDDEKHPPTKAFFRSEYDRPIYFLELRDSYICSWCELHGNKLISIPHPLSPQRVREFSYPKDAEIIGRVVALATRIVDNGKSNDFKP